MKTRYLLGLYVLILILCDISHAQETQSITLKHNNLVLDSISLLNFDKENIRADHTFGIGEELYINLHNIKGFDVKNNLCHFGYKIDISSKDDGTGFKHSSSDFTFTPDPGGNTLYFPLYFDDRFTKEETYTANIFCYDLYDTATKHILKKNLKISFDFCIDSKYTIKRIETTSNELNLSYFTSYFSTNPPVPSRTNVFKYQEKKYKVDYYLKQINDQTKSIDATADIFLVYYGDFNPNSGNYITFNIGSGIRLEHLKTNLHGSFMIGKPSYGGIGKGSYSIVSIVKDNLGKNKLVNTANFYVVDKDSVLNNINYSNINSKQHLDLPKNGEPSLFGRSPIEFKRYIKFHLANIIEGTDYISDKKVRIAFTIDKTGQVINTKVVGCDNKWLEEQIIKIAEGCPTWRPKTVNGQPVPINYSITVGLNLSYD
ncbi:energy transducer TonB [Aquimarina mytili]|uniref:Energy transducer TonB n=1 Tax=Aquimarina mytili TaxID=874423 RepID=A0A936ZRX9_9FLAO|nr:energy transducer TonB [Aquimarina mytili]MBL0684302.1 energy transducer TonB [Aquimarina mytili]